MKKITLLFILLTVSIGFSQQVLIEDFESSPALHSWDGAAVVVGTDPVGSNGQNMEVTTTAGAGQFWQGAAVTLPAGIVMDLTTDITVMVDIYSTSALTIMGKVESNTGAPAAADDEAHGGTGWETITFTFNTGADGTATANGEYNVFAVFPSRDGAGGWINPVIGSLTMYDNLTAVLGTVAPTCTDGIMNGNETGIDCGGPDCPPCVADAPNPTTPNGEVLNIYSDTGGFTNTWSPDYSFGSFAAKLDLDQGTGVDEAIKMDFSVAGYGEGTNSPVDISAYNYVHFDYFAPNIAAGVNGHEVKFILIGDGEGEKDYVLKTDMTGDGTLVFDAWQSVNVPLSHFEALGLTKPNYLQFKLGTTSDLNTTIVYFDNIYFSVNPGTLGTSEFETTDFSVYPNPTNNVWNIKSSQTIESVLVYDILGKQVLSVKNNLNEAQIDASALPSGLYFAKISAGSSTKSIKLIKE